MAKFFSTSEMMLVQTLIRKLLEALEDKEVVVAAEDVEVEVGAAEVAVEVMAAVEARVGQVVVAQVVARQCSSTRC
ncbi:hypothetical protein ACYZTL_01960 [Pseudomonas sp. LB3P81]